MDRVTAHALLMAPLAWLVAAGAATLGEILPSFAARRALGYGTLPYNFKETPSRTATSGALLPCLLATVMGCAVIGLVREERSEPWGRAGLAARLFAWAFVVQYAAQGSLFFTLQRDAVASWTASSGVTLVTAALYAATALATLPLRTRLCARVAG